MSTDRGGHDLWLVIGMWTFVLVLALMMIAFASRSRQSRLSAWMIWLAGFALFGLIIGVFARHPDHAARTSHSSHSSVTSTITVTASAPVALPRRVVAHDKAAPEGPYVGTVLNIHDGDTLTLEDQLGFEITHTFKCRVRTMTQGINARELSTAQGKADLAYALTRIHVGDHLINYDFGDDKYGGRRDCDLREADGTDFGDDMLNSGHAVPYNP
jgi:endonuclease YncB( thermonuclease family)